MDPWGRGPQAVLKAAPHSDNPSQSSLSLSGTANGDGYSWGPLPEPDTRVPLPVDALPALLHDYTAGLSEQLQVPPELVLLPALAVLAGASRGRWRVDGPAPDWHEHLSLYVAVFLPPGELKSPTLREVAAPLREYERQLQDTRRQQVEQDTERRQLLEQRVKSLRGQVARRPLDTELAAEYHGAVTQLHSCPPVYAPRLLAQDVTPERLATLLAEQSGTLTVLAAEGGLVGTLAGRYSDGVANLDLVNSAHTGERVTVDRQGRDPVHLDTPHLALGLAVQPDVLRELHGNTAMRGRGFVDRFLLSVPESRLGTRQLDSVALNRAVREQWTERVTQLLHTATGLLDAGTREVLPLHPGARERFQHFRQQHEPRLSPSGDLAHVTGWANKLPGQLLRIAALLQLLDEPHSEHVSEQSTTAALALAPYLVGQALYVHGNPVTGPTARVLAAVAGQPQDVFSTRDVHRSVQNQSWCKQSEQVQHELAQLYAAGFVRRLPSEYGNKSQQWQRHPLLTPASATCR